ncbi:MAG: histidinol-phosphatase HisJ family protein [Clostridia bacterium]|nr:histidinol-phosphatase HisJ family protein [Clostridia bacterium]
MRSNYHTHSVYCDGKDTPREMAAEAYALGFAALGFSGHSDPSFSDCGMTPEKETAYRREIAALKDEYAGRMEIYCGIERDILAGMRPAGYDYVIGSVHWIEKDGEHLPIDWTAEKARDNIQRVYHGDQYAYAEDYYGLMAQVKEKTGCDIIGHFDLLTKFEDRCAFFDQQHPRYRAAALSALDALAVPGTVFEINTGAMARGHRATPYPALWILEELKRRRCAVMINSDCHDRSKLTFGFELAAELAREAGFDSQIVIRNGKMTDIAIE